MSNENPNEPKEPPQKESVGVSGDTIETYSSLKNAIWATFLSFLVLAVTQLLTYCANKDLENKKRESELIKQALTPENQQSEQNLIFLVRAGLIDCKQFDGDLNELIPVDDNLFNNYRIPRGDKDGKLIIFTNQEKKCNLIRALLTVPPKSFGSSLPTASSTLTPITPKSDITSISSKYDKANNLQNQGFRKLLEQDIVGAKSLFKSAFQTYPNLYNIEEINRLIQPKDKTSITDWGIEIYCPIVDQYSWGMPEDQKKQMITKGNCSPK